MATNKYVVNGDQMSRFGKKIAELMRQVHSQNECPHDPEDVIFALQDIIEGRFHRTLPSVAEKKIFAEWCAKWPTFWNMFGVNVSQVMSHQNFPKQPLPGFPWIIVDPGLMDDQALAKTLFEKLEIPYWVSVALLKYTNSAEPNKLSIIMVRDTIEPDKEYLGKSADDADQITAEKGTKFILCRHWIILFAFLWWLTKGKQKLDIKGWTWFSKNRLAGGSAAYGYWAPSYGRVGLNYRDDDYVCGDAGPRVGKFFTL